MRPNLVLLLMVIAGTSPASAAGADDVILRTAIFPRASALTGGFVSTFEYTLYVDRDLG